MIENIIGTVAENSDKVTSVASGVLGGIMLLGVVGLFYGASGDLKEEVHQDIVRNKNFVGYDK